MSFFLSTLEIERFPNSPLLISKLGELAQNVRASAGDAALEPAFDLVALRLRV